MLLEPRVAELEEEVARLKELLGRAKGVNDAMWDTVVKKVVKQSKEATTINGEDNGRARKRGRVEG